MGKLNNDMKHFKREPKGKREEFNEELLYELYKERPFDNFQQIRGFIFRQHGVYASTNLMTRITNYQIRKYGCIKTTGKNLIPLYLHGKGSRRRQRERVNRENNREAKNFLKRVDRRGYYDESKAND